MELKGTICYKTIVVSNVETDFESGLKRIAVWFKYQLLSPHLLEMISVY